MDPRSQVPSLLAQAYQPGNVEVAASVSESICAHHAPTKDSLGKIEELRCQAARLMEAVLETSLPCPERSTAIAKVREALMWGNAAIIFTQPAPTYQNDLVMHHDPSDFESRPALTEADADADLKSALAPEGEDNFPRPDNPTKP